MTVNRNHIKSKGILSLVSSNVNISATVTWHSFITFKRRTVWHRHNISSSSEATGSPVQRILLPFECKSFSLLFRSCMQVMSANYVNMNNKLNCTHAGIFFSPFPSLLQPTAPPAHLRVFYHWLLQFILSSFRNFQEREVHADCVTQLHWNYERDLFASSCMFTCCMRKPFLRMEELPFFNIT